jgi:DNA-binding MurR/RpiR family transcriptional regulator
MSLVVAEVLRQGHLALTPAERKLARVLLADYPLAGLEPVSSFAARAGVSGPTVLRLAAKLGFAGYPQFQQALKEELAGRLASPLAQYDSPSTEEASGGVPGGNGAPAGPAARAVQRSEAVLREGIRETFAGLAVAELEQAVALLTDPRRRVLTVGGRFSAMLAQYLAIHLQLLRPDTRHLPLAGTDRVASLLDVGARDVLVVFDYRRYQKDTVQFGEQAKAQRAGLILFTDPWLSPLAGSADVVLTSTVRAPSPFDALTPSLALVEAVIAAVVDELGERPRGRLERFEELQSDVLHDARPTSDPARRPDPGGRDTGRSTSTVSTSTAEEGA